MHIPSHQAILTDSEYEIYISESIFSHIIFYTHLYGKRKTSDRLVQILFSGRYNLPGLNCLDFIRARSKGSVASISKHNSAGIPIP